MRSASRRCVPRLLQPGCRPRVGAWGLALFHFGCHSRRIVRLIYQVRLNNIATLY